jgi:hypothetical protein
VFVTELAAEQNVTVWAMYDATYTVCGVRSQQGG